MKDSINTVRHFTMAGLQAGTIVTWPSNDQEFKPTASLAEV